MVSRAGTPANRHGSRVGHRRTRRGRQLFVQVGDSDGENFAVRPAWHGARFGGPAPAGRIREHRPARHFHAGAQGRSGLGERGSAPAAHRDLSRRLQQLANSAGPQQWQELGGESGGSGGAPLCGDRRHGGNRSPPGPAGLQRRGFAGANDARSCSSALSRQRHVPALACRLRHQESARKPTWLPRLRSTPRV